LHIAEEVSAVVIEEEALAVVIEEAVGLVVVDLYNALNNKYFVKPVEF
jgi:hypothetical protein